MPRCRTSRSGCGFERDTIARAFQRLNGPVADPLGMTTIVVVGFGWNRARPRIGRAVAFRWLPITSCEQF
jgi:hypothetical protein